MPSPYCTGPDKRDMPLISNSPYSLTNFQNAAANTNKPSNKSVSAEELVEKNHGQVTQEMIKNYKGSLMDLSIAQQKYFEMNPPEVKPVQGLTLDVTT